MSEIVEKAEKYVSALLTEKLDPRFLYHNLRHTQDVVKSTKELLNFHPLGAAEKEQLLLAAWFHDVGYTQGWDNHEQHSCSMAQAFLSEHGHPPGDTARVCELIMATRMEHTPKDQMEAIIKDADLSHFVHRTYWDTTDMLREELKNFGLADYSDRQ